MDTTTIKGFKVLEILAQSDTPLGIPELSEQTGLTRSNVQRILVTLATLDYIHKLDETSRYTTTIKMWQLGVNSLLRQPIVRAARSALKSLYAKTGETIILCVPDGDYVVYVEKLESQNPIRISCAIGTRLPLHSTAAGRVLAAFADESQQQRVCEALPDQRKSSMIKFRKQLKVIRERGYEVSNGQYRKGINSVAAPLWDETGRVVASVAVSGPEERLCNAVIDSHIQLLLDNAAHISGSLGYLGAG